MVRERRRPLAAEQASQADLGGRRAHQVASPDDEIDALVEGIQETAKFFGDAIDARARA
jgi:hypothetical protein